MRSVRKPHIDCDFCAGIALSLLFFLTSLNPALSQNSNLKWQRLPGAALDLGLSHRGHMWGVGSDRYAYRWDAAKKTWLRYGKRKDFARIDGAEDGSAVAVTTSGGLYYTTGKATGSTKWMQAGHRVRDIGLGGGWAWITKTDKVSGGGQVWRARNEQNGDFNWQRVPGGMVHIDAGPGGGAWGVNDQNNVFQFVGGKWRKHTAKATDIGVGGEGTVWIVGTDIVNRAGGGTLHRRDIRTGKWIKDARRLRTVTAGPIDQPAGVNSAKEIWDKSARAVTAGNQGPTDNGPTDGPGGEGGAGTTPDPAMQRRVVTKHSGNWYRLPGAALDLGLGHKGHIWAIGSDRFAYRWDAGKKSWVRHGTRKDLMHIDAAPDGGALAVSTSGEVYFTSAKRTGRDRWTRVGGKASDVGIGGGWAWITGAEQNSGGGQVWRARYDGSGNFSWRRIRGSPSSGLFHIDADPNGNAWGVNNKNEIYRFDGQKWSKISGKAIDIGIGADNSVWIAGGDVVEQKGGGTLAQYDARTRKWVKEGKRLRNVTAGIGGSPAGTNHTDEIWVRNFGDKPQSKGTNLALRKKTTQSPQNRLRGHAARAVDGNTDGNFKNGSVTDIRSGNIPPWIKVDLGAIYQIDAIRIHNRTDCCGSRLGGAIVETSNTGDWKGADTTFAGTIRNALPVIDFKVGKTGRYVRVRHTAVQVLGLAEIEVFGLSRKVKAVPSNVAGKKPVIKLPQDWTKLAGQALDMGLGSGGHMWVIGTDKYAYRWDAAKKAWVRHGTRQDFERIDVAADGGALAVTSNGGLFHTGSGAAGNPAWVQVGGKTRDVGIGGGWVWITSTTKTNGGGLVARSRYDGSGKFNWQRVSQGFVHIDAGEDGNAWGVDDQGDVYQYTGERWRKHGGKKATDIGVGGDNTVWIVGANTNDAAGGGTLHRFEMGSGGWVSDTVRLKTVTANGYGQPAGINSANEIWARDFKVGASTVAVAGGTKQTPKGKTAKITEVAGAKASLPEGLKDITLEQIKTEKGFTTGKVMLNGNPAVVVTYTPKGKSAPNTIIWHKRFKFSDYMPDAGGTPLDKIGTLNNTAFAIVPKGNANTTMPPAVVAYLDGLRGGEGNPFPNNISLKEGVNLVAGFDTAQMPGIKQFTALFRRKPKNFLLAGTVDGSIFKNVKQTPVKPTPSLNTVDMAKLVKVYGQTFLKNLVLEGEKLPKFETGPLTYTDAKYEVSGEAGAIQVGFEVSMEMEVKSSQGGTVTFDAIRVDYDQEENTVTLTGDVSAEETKNLVSYRVINVEKMTFEGAMPEGQPLSLKIDGSGKIKSKPTDFEIILEEYNNKYEATLKLKGELTLAEILDDVFKRGEISGLDEIVLTEVEIGKNYQAGIASLAGEDVRFAAFQPTGENTMVAVEHRVLQLANYLPQIADTPVKGLGLGRSVFIIVKDLKNSNSSDLLGSTLEVTKADKEKLLPSYIVKMLDKLESEATAKAFGKSIYPLTLRSNGTTMISLYTTGKGQVSTTDAEQQKVIDSLDIQDDTYILKGFVNKDMIRAARYAKKQAAGSGKGKGGSSLLRKVVLPLLDGLDIGFPIPAFQPPKTKGLITFSESKFRLKGIDDKLETFVSSGMSVKLPDSGKTGVKAIDMVGKVKPVVLKENLEVEFAATTQLSGTQADETSFARLKALNDPDAEEAVSALVPTSEPTQGWQKAFGIPFLTVEQMSVGGSFTDGGTTGDVNVNVGMQTIVEDQSPGQRLVLKGELVVSDIHEIEDIVLEIPGSVKIAALPGIKDIPGVNALTFSDVKLSRYELAGQVGGRGATLDGVLSRNPEGSDYALYLAANDINLGTFSQKFSRKLPSTFGDFPIQSGVMVGSNMDTQQGIVVADLPERAQALFENIVADDAEITIAKGVSVFTKLEPEKLPESNKFRKLFVKGFGFKEPLLFEGAIEDSGGSATPKVRLAASIPNYKIPGVSDKILEFTGSRMVLEDISGALTGSVEGEMTFKVKGKQFALENGKVSAAVDGKDKEVVVTGVSTQEWTRAFGIPFLTLNRLELDVNVKTSDAGPDVDWGIKTKSVLNKGKPKDEQAFDANGKLEVVENVVTDIVLELPGEVDIKKLPAIGKVPVINQLSYSDVKLSIYEIAANVLWTGTTTSLAGVFVRDRDKPDETKYTLYSAVQNTKINNLVGLFSPKAANKIPGTLKDFPINSGVVVVSNQPNETLEVSDLPERVQPLFAGYFPPEKELTIVKGASVYTTIARDNTKKDDPVWSLLFGEKTLNLKDPVTFEGSIIKEQEDKAKVRLAASIPTYKIPLIPENILKFENSQVVFSNESDTTAAIVGEMMFKALDKTHELDGSVTYAKSGKNTEATVSGTSKGDWDKAFGIPGLTLSNPTLQVNAKRGDASSTGLGIKSAAAFGGQKVDTKGELAIADSKLAGASFTLEGTVSMKTVPGIKEIPGVKDFTFTDVVLSRNLIAGSNLIAGQTTWDRIAKDKKLDAAFIEKDGKFAMLMKVDSFSIGQLSSGVPSPVSKITIPNSVVAVSNQEFGAFDADGLPELVRKRLFDPIIGEKTGEKIKISEGVTVLTKLEPVTLLKPLPDLVKTAMEKAVQVKEPVVVAGTIGGVFGGEPSAALYAKIPKTVIPGGDVLKKTLNFGNVTFFIRAQESTVSQIGFGGTMDFKMPRLDVPGKFDELNLVGELYMDLGAVEPGMEIAGKMTGRWVNPMGLNDFTFEDTEIKIGVNPSSLDVGFGGQAEFNSKKDGLVYYAMDLLVGIVPGTIVPKKLAVQFVGKLKQGDQLVDGARIGPMTMMEMADSVFRGIFAGGMSAQVINQIPDASAKKAAEQLRKLVRSNTLLTPLKKIPLPLLSVLNPKVYLSTPGAGLPARKGLEQPPFGLGAIMSGHLDFTLLGKSQNLANADMRLTLTDGLRIKAEFPEKNLHVIKTGANLDIQAGLFDLGSASFKMSGKAELFSPLDKLGGKASFDLGISQSGPLTNPTMHMNGSAQAGPFGRKVGLKVSPTEIDFYSPPECTSPISVSAKASYGDFKSFQFQNLIPQVVPRPDEVFNCNPLDLAKWIGNAAKKVGEGIAKGGEEIGKGTVKAAEAVVKGAKEAAKAAGTAASAAANGLKSAGSYVSNGQAFKDGLDLTRAAWGHSIRQVPLLGDVLGAFSEELGGAASAAINESVKAVRKAAIEAAKAAAAEARRLAEEAAKYLNPGNWGSLSVGDDRTMAAVDSAMMRIIKADPHFQGAPQPAKDQIIATTRELEKKLRQVNRDLQEANQQRMRLEKARQAEIDARKVVKQKLAKLVDLALKEGGLKNASHCPHGQYWNTGLARCWTDGYALLQTKRWVEGRRTVKSETRSKCMAVDQNGELWKDWCSTDPSAPNRTDKEIRFKIGRDGTVRTPGGKCLGLDDKAQNTGKFAQVLALNCSGAATQKWKFDSRGRFVASNGLCITQLGSTALKNTNLKPDVLRLADCEKWDRQKPYDWTPLFGTPDYRAQGPKKLPDTLMLRYRGNCINGGIPYNAQPTLDKCDTNNAHQMLAVSFVDDKHFVIASRTSHYCLTAQPGTEEGLVPVVNTPCLDSENQQFFLDEPWKYGTRIKSRQTGLCLTAGGGDNYWRPGAPLAQHTCGYTPEVHGGRQWFRVDSIDKIPSFTPPPKKQPTQVSQAEILENLRAAYLYQTVLIQPAGRFGFRFRANEVRQAGKPSKTKLAMTAQKDWYTMFQIVPGRTNQAGTVSLQSIGRSRPGGGVGSPRNNPRCLNNSVRNQEHFLAINNKETRGGRFLHVRKAEISNTFNRDATFRIVPSLDGVPGRISLVSVIPGREWPYIVTNQNNLIFMSQGSPAAALSLVKTANPFKSWCGQ